jgi:carbonic anhydrase/acetyltransferase-like protein (isoleucine patch superfamily)
MAIYEFEGKKPIIGNDSYISDSAEVIGDVVVGDGCYVGPGAKVRGDYGGIRVGDGSGIEENCVLHARPEEFCTLGNMVTIGHGSILHNCTIKDYAIIGMGAVVSDWAVVGVWSVVAEGAVVRQRQEIPDGKICVGVPAKVIGDVQEEYKKQWEYFKREYIDLAKRYPGSLKKI